MQDWTSVPVGSNVWETMQVGPGSDALGITAITFNGTLLHDYNNGGGGTPMNLVSLNFPNLVQMGNSIDNGNLNSSQIATMTSISIPVLVRVGLSLVIAGCNLSSFSAPALTTLGFNGGGDFDLDNNAHLTTVSIPALVFPNGHLVDASGCALTAASVNGILRRCVVSGLTTSDIELAGGTNAAPSGQGVADKATLIAAGNTVNTN